MSKILFNEINRIEITDAHRDFLAAYDIFMKLNYENNTPPPPQIIDEPPHKRKLELVSESVIDTYNKKHQDQFEEYKKDHLEKKLFGEPILRKNRLSKLLSFGCLFPNKDDYKTQKERSEYFYKLKLEIEENILPAIEAAVIEKEMKYVLDNDEFIDWLRDHPKIKAGLKNNQLKCMIETDEFKCWLNEHPEIKATVIEKHMESVDEEKSLMKWLEEYLDPRYFEDAKHNNLIKNIIIESESGSRISFEERIALEIFDFIKNKKGLGNAHRCKTCGNYFIWHNENKKICTVYCRGKKWYNAHKKKGRKSIA